MDSPPNILYIHSHDTGRVVQPYGFQVPTPNIQLLADQGVLFREAFCAAPTCSGSRASLLTGLHCHNNGMLGLAHRGWALNDYGQHWVHALRGAGYRSTLIGEQHISVDPGVIGYDEIVPVDSNHAEYVAPLTIEALREAPSEPWFMSVGFFETHRDFFAPTSVRDTLYSLPPANLPDVAATRKDMAAFKASARSLDQGIGAVLHALHDFGLVENTLVLCTTDHGIAFPGAKATLFDRGHRGDDADARARRLHRRQGDRRPGQPPRRLPDPLRAGRGRGAALAAGRLADAAGAGRGRAAARGDLRRDDLPRRLPAAARGPHRALEVHPPLRRLRAPGAGQLRRQREQGPPGRGRLGGADRPPRAALRPGARPRRGRQPRRRASPRRGPRGDARAPRCLDAETEDPLLDGPVAPPAGATVNEQWQVSPDEPPRAVTADPTAAASS